jgi:uncharacterized protein (TIGR02145 family)
MGKQKGRRYKMKKVTIMLALFFVAAFAQQQGTFTDTRDKKTYKTVKIGKQIWMAENLNYAAKGSKCYDNKPANCQKYGRFYGQGTAESCPKGWHLPSNADWDKLLRFADGTSGTESPYSSETAGKLLKAKNGWNDYEGKSGNGTDDFGFAALPGGYGSSDGRFSTVGNYGNWWSTEFTAYTADLQGTLYSEEAHNQNYHHESSLFSVRCILD